MVNGRRITSPEMMDVATMVYGGLVNKRIVSKLQALGVNALGLTGADLNMIRAHKRPVEDIDYGLAGDIDEVNISYLSLLLTQKLLPVLAPITHDGNGQLLNTNADTIASTVARNMAYLYEVTLVYTFEKAGVLKDPEDDASLIPHITADSYQQYKQQGIIAGDMIPYKLDNAFDALKERVKQVVICRADTLRNLGEKSFVGTTLSKN